MIVVDDVFGLVIDYFDDEFNEGLEVVWNVGGDVMCGNVQEDDVDQIY